MGLIKFEMHDQSHANSEDLIRVNQMKKSYGLIVYIKEMCSYMQNTCSWRENKMFKCTQDVVSDKKPMAC